MYLFYLVYLENLFCKLGKNQNNSHISIFQIYLPKLHENNYKLSQYREIAIGFNHGHQTISKSPATFSTLFLFKMVNIAVIVAFRLHLLWYYWSHNKHWVHLSVRVPLLDVSSSSSNPLDPGSTTSSTRSMKASMLSRTPCGKINGSITSPLLVISQTL